MDRWSTSDDFTIKKDTQIPIFYLNMFFTTPDSKSTIAMLYKIVTSCNVFGFRNKKAKSDKKLGKSSPSNACASPSHSASPRNVSRTLSPGGQLTNRGDPSGRRSPALTCDFVRTGSPVGAAPTEPCVGVSPGVSGVRATGSDVRGSRHDNRRRFQKNETNLARLKERRDKSVQRKSQLNMLPPDQPGGCHDDDLLSSSS